LISPILATYYNAPKAEDDLPNAFHRTIIRQGNITRLYLCRLLINEVYFSTAKIHGIFERKRNYSQCLLNWGTNTSRLFFQMPEWGVTDIVHLQQITSYAFTAQSSLFGLKPQPERHLSSSRTTTSSCSPLRNWVRSSCASVYITARQQARGQPGANYLRPGLQKLTGLQSAQSRYRGSIPGKGKQFYCFPKRPDRIWGRPTFLFTGYRGLFSKG